MVAILDVTIVTIGLIISAVITAGLVAPPPSANEETTEPVTKPVVTKLTYKDVDCFI